MIFVMFNGEIIKLELARALNCVYSGQENSIPVLTFGSVL